MANQTDFAAVVLQKTALKIMALQCLLASLVALYYFLLQNSFWGGLSALFGGFVAVLGVLLSSRQIQRAACSENKAAGYRAIYVGALQKFLATLILIGLGIAYFKLNPIALLIAFGMSQLAFTFNKVDSSVNTSIQNK